MQKIVKKNLSHFELLIQYLSVGIASLHHELILLEYALQSVTILYNKIKYNIFVTLSHHCEELFQTSPPILVAVAVAVAALIDFHLCSTFYFS